MQCHVRGDFRPIRVNTSLLSSKENLHMTCLDPKKSGLNENLPRSKKLYRRQILEEAKAVVKNKIKKYIFVNG